MNIVYFGGYSQVGIKFTANSLPNDPRVHKLSGGTKSMFKNIMEAKFDKILLQTTQEILLPSLLLKLDTLDKESFNSLITLHEVPHTLGKGFVDSNDSLSVGKALKEKFFAIEECKADVLGLNNHKHFFDKGLINKDFLKAQ